MSDATAVAPDPSPAADTGPAWESTVFAADKPGELIPDWHTKAPDPKAYEPYKSAKNWREAVDMADGRVKEAQRALHEKRSADAGLPPKPDGEAATPEAWAEYYKARNLPTDPKEYGITKPDDLPDAIWESAKMDSWAALLHKLEVPPEAAKELVGYWNQQSREALTQYAQQQEAAKAAEALAKDKWVREQKEFLVQDFGVEVDPAINKIQKLTGLAKEALDPAIPEQYLGREAIRALASLVKMIPATGDFTRQKLGGSPNVNTVQSREYWKTLDPKSDDYKALSDSNHPRHKQVYEARAEAYRIDAELRDAQ